METYAEWFCLNAGRVNFIPDVVKDCGLIFCHKEIINNKLVNRIENSFLVHKPPKMVVYGDWGVGKTHALNHIRWWLKENENKYPAETYYIELGDLKKKSKFDLLLRPLLEQITLNKLIELIDGFRAKGKDPSTEFRKAGARPGVADAFRRFMLVAPGTTPTEEVKEAFIHIQGGSGTNFDQPLKESEEFYSVLLCIGELFKEVESKQVIFIVDELAKFDEIDMDQESTLHWINMNKAIFDRSNKSFGIIYSLNGQEEELPDILYHDQLKNRITAEGYIQFNNLGPADVSQFLKDLTHNFVDQDKLKKLKDGGVLPGDYDLDEYPFTAKAREHFLDYWNQTQEDAKPRDIAEKLENLAIHAMKNKSRLIEDSYLSDENM